jgi:hypothetical protein
MKREGHEKAAFFIGPEVEQSPAFGKKTLFVVGRQDLARIESIAKEHKTPHIFMGANHSFDFNAEKDNLSYWKDTIVALLDKGFYVTLDYKAEQHADVLNVFSRGVWQCRTFVPMLRVEIPYIQTSSPNLVVKIDDIDFKATNEGVWCMHHHELTDSNRFTSWDEYGTDVVISKVDDVNIGEGVSMRIDPLTGRRVYRADPIVKKAVVDEDPRGLDTISPTAIEQAEIRNAEKNTQDLGLDPAAPSALNDEGRKTTMPIRTPEETAALKKKIAEDLVASGKIKVPATEEDVANLYAGDVKEDGVAKAAKGKKKKTT